MICHQHSCLLCQAQGIKFETFMLTSSVMICHIFLSKALKENLKMFLGLFGVRLSLNIRREVVSFLCWNNICNISRNTNALGIDLG